MSNPEKREWNEDLERREASAPILIKISMWNLLESQQSHNYPFCVPC